MLLITFLANRMSAAAGKESCHSCGGSCGGKSVSVANNEQLVAEITKKVMEQLSK